MNRPCFRGPACNIQGSSVAAGMWAPHSTAGNKRNSPCVSGSPPIGEGSRLKDAQDPSSSGGGSMQVRCVGGGSLPASSEVQERAQCSTGSHSHPRFLWPLGPLGELSDQQDRGWPPSLQMETQSPGRALILWGSEAHISMLPAPILHGPQWLLQGPSFPLREPCCQGRYTRRRHLRLCSKITPHYCRDAFLYPVLFIKA